MTTMPLRYIGFAAMAAAVQGQNTGPECREGGLTRFDAAMDHHTASNAIPMHSTSTAAECADICLADEGDCEGFTWVSTTNDCILHEFRHRFSDLVSSSNGASYYDKTACRATCSDTAVDNYNLNAGVRPKWASSWIRDFQDYTVEQCAQACWDQAACLSFTMLNGNDDSVDDNRCQLYQREFTDGGLTPSLVSSNGKDKDTYVQQKCTRSGPRAQFQRAGGFRSTSFTVEDRTTKDGEPVVDEDGQPETRNVYVRSAYVVPTAEEPETGYRPKNAGAFTAVLLDATVESCQEFCVSVGLLKCKGYLFRPGTGNCKTYSTAYGPNYLVASTTKVFYRLAL